MKQLSLILLLVTSSSSFAMQTTPPPPDSGDRNEGYDLKVEITEPSTHSGKRKTRSDSFHFLTDEDPWKNKQLIVFLKLVAREQGETRPPSGVLRHFKVVPDEGN